MISQEKIDMVAAANLTLANRFYEYDYDIMVNMRIAHILMNYDELDTWLQLNQIKVISRLLCMNKNIKSFSRNILINAFLKKSIVGSIYQAFKPFRSESGNFNHLLFIQRLAT